MAFSTNVTTERGKIIANAYVKASVLRCTPTELLIQCEVWEDAETRESGVTPVTSFHRSFATTDVVTSSNPLDYAYQVLEASNEWPGAVWNI